MARAEMTADVAARGSKSARAHAHIRDAILDGTYPPGHRLVLGQIAKEIDVSVVPVREAIRRLEAEGLVTFRHHVGAQVAMAHESQYRDTMYTLGVVEGAATALAAPRVDAAALARARAINAEMVAALDDFEPARFTELNLQFHTVLFERCPNGDLLEAVRREWTRLGMLRRSTFDFVPERARRSVEEHERLVSLIEAGADPLTVEMAARDHRLATLSAYDDRDH